MSGAAQKLTAEQVADIKRRLAAGEKQAVLAMIHGVSSPVISGINRGIYWK